MKFLKKHISLVLTALILAGLAGAWFFLKNDGVISLENQGETAFNRRNYQRAVALWKSALKHDPGNVHLHIRLGQAYWRLAEWNDAEKNIHIALTARPEDSRLRIEMARILLLKGNINSARDQVVKLSAVSPDNPEVHVLSGDINIIENKTQKALSDYRKALLLSSGETRYLLKLTACLHALKKDHEAETYFNMARDKKNRRVEDFIQFADYYNHMNDNVRAEAALQRAIHLEPESINIIMRLTDLYISTGQFKKALPVLEKILKTDPTNRYVQMAMADVYISLNHFKKAENLIRSLGGRKSEKNFGLELLQGKFWLYQGNTAFAAIHLKSAVDMAPTLTMGYYYLALAYLASGQEKLAENSLKSVLMLVPDHAEATLLMAGLLYKKEHYLISLQYIDRLIKKKPENDEAHLLKGLDLLKLGADKKAARSIMAALAIDPVNASAWYYLGLVFESLKKNTQALKAYGRALSLNPDLIDAAYHYSGLLIKTKGRNALYALNHFLNGKEKTRAIYYASARTAMAMGENQLSAACLKKAMGMGKKVPYYLVEHLARVEKAMGHDDEAQKILEDYTRQYSGSEAGWIGLASYYRNMGSLTKAKQTMEKAEKRLPDSPVILANLAWIYLESNIKTDLALDLARQAYEQMPDDPGITDTLGWCYYKKGDYVQAGWIFSEMEKKYPDNGLVLYHGGATLYKQGKTIQAMNKLKKALILDLNKKEKGDIMAMLSEIKDRKKSGTAASADFTKKEFLNSLKLSPPEAEDILKPQWKNNL